MPTAPNSSSEDFDPASVSTILLAGGRGTRLFELTANESKPALFFAGGHRIIDFAMANLVRSGLDRLLVATQFAPQTLAAHLPTRWSRHFKSGELAIKDGRDSYRGTADALRRNWQTIEAWGGTEIMVLAADHIYEMDYGALIRAHRASGAAVTVAVDIVPQKQASGFGVMHANRQGTITSFLEKPANPPAIVGEPGFSMASMGIYVFSKSWIQNALSANVAATDFGQHIIPNAVEQGVAMAYRLPPSNTTGKVYWRDIGTLDALRLAQLDFAAGGPCRLPGPVASSPWRVSNDSILMPGATLLGAARLSRTIVAPGTRLPSNAVIGEDPLEDGRWFRRTEGGTVLVTQAMLDRRAEQRSSSRFVRLGRIPRSGLSGPRLRLALDSANG
ncbi:sugar phosphate nucleotidyltransferase [Pelagibacterium sp. H642]|uniref:sugar phosphate nucleotidyltransferase n=1 Tax=Pelagibacterium sp. H642 TaxID=1881069 RepID=UPI0028149BC9|nr:sugar phosphate nucleotidyltransferase [Pelagibacterium sp. H642]WMT92854.1 sugar phosphate nucleotidyltransferase [Pelagibacterium sp. H642]